MMILLLLIVTLTCSFLYYSKYRKNEPFHPPPGPKGLPFIGNLHQYDFSTPHVYMTKLAKTYGPVMSFRLGCVHMVVVQSAELAKEVLKTRDLDFCTRPPLVGMQKLSYNGLDISFSQYNEYFREVKKMGVVHLLSSIRVRSFAPIQQDEISRLINDVSSAPNPVNLSNLATDFLCRLLCSIAFGRSYEDDESSMLEFHRLLDESEVAFGDLAYRDYFPSIGWLDKLTGKSARLDRIFHDLDAFYKKIIDDHLQSRDNINHNREDFIDVLLNLRKDRSFGFPLTLDHVKALLMDMFLAGTDTSSVMIIWAMTELIKNPRVMKKVQDELRNDATKRGEYISEGDLQNLEYFKAVVKETFRLHPPAPLLIAHQAIRKSKINGYDILPGTLVFTNVWAIGRDPTTWKDPDKFMPERFLGSSIDFKGQNFELIPFGAGRRMCPGLHLGALNFELGLANLLCSFDWELPVGTTTEDVDTNTLPGVVVHKMNPLCLVANKYS